jgi:hypothetical protein
MYFEELCEPPQNSEPIAVKKIGFITIYMNCLCLIKIRVNLVQELFSSYFFWQAFKPSGMLCDFYPDVLSDEELLTHNTAVDYFLFRNISARSRPGMGRSVSRVSPATVKK